MNNNIVNRYNLIGRFLIITFFFHTLGFAQSPINSNKYPQKDIIDFLHLQPKDSTKSKETKDSGNGPFFSVMPAVGYSMLSGFTGLVVANATFFTDSVHHKFSNVLLNAAYSQFKQYWFTLNTCFYFEKYKLHFVSDTRYYKFPTQTYGLSIYSTFADKLQIDYSYLRADQILYRSLASNFFMGLGYHLDYHWNINSGNTPGKTLSDFNTFNKATHTTSSGFTFNMLFDNRINTLNPQQGYYAYLQFRPNLMVLGSDDNWQQLEIDLRHYIPFPKNSRNVLCFWSYNKLTFGGIAPYLDMPSLGWDEYSNTGRGYVPGRFTANNLMYLETEYRYVITRNGLLGGVVFGNATSVFQYYKNETHKFVPGGGLGLRIKMNKHSNTNLDIDYGFGIGGSHGFNFNLGEMF
jgi:outer membrane protein assembly factor BamA